MRTDEQQNPESSLVKKASHKESLGNCRSPVPICSPPQADENGAAIMPCDLTELQAMLARRERTEKLTALRKALERVSFLALSACPQVRGDLEAEAREELADVAGYAALARLQREWGWRWAAAVLLAGLAWRVLGDARGPPRGYNVNGI